MADQRAAQIEHSALRGRELLGVYWNNAPRQIAAATPAAEDDWALYGPALLARSAYLLESILALAERDIDAGVLTRCLFDHSVAFAWIAIKPGEHMQRAICEEYGMRVAAHNELVRLDGEGIFTVEELAGFAAYTDRFPRDFRPPRSVQEMAWVVDEFWTLREPSLAACGFRYMYTIVFRQFSSFTHPTAYALQRFVSGPRDGKYEVGPAIPAPDAHAVVLGPLVFAHELLLAETALGWPVGSAAADVLRRLGLTPEERGGGDAP